MFPGTGASVTATAAAAVNVTASRRWYTSGGVTELDDEDAFTAAIASDTLVRNGVCAMAWCALGTKERKGKTRLLDHVDHECGKNDLNPPFLVD